MQYDINREAADISALSSGNINNDLIWNMNYEIWIDKYEYLTGEEIEQTSQVCVFSFSNSFWKANKNNKDQGEKQFEALELLKPKENKEETKSIEGPFPNDLRSNEIKK